MTCPDVALCYCRRCFVCDIRGVQRSARYLFTLIAPDGERSQAPLCEWHCQQTRIRSQGVARERYPDAIVSFQTLPARCFARLPLM